MKIVPVTDYFAMLPERIANARTRIVLSAMVIAAGKATNPSLHALRQAAECGVKVILLYDGYYTGLPQAYQKFWPWQAKAERQETARILRQLQKAGVQVLSARAKRGNPYKGAYHAKVTIIDNEILAFGGVNFDDSALQTADYMLQSYNGRLADMLEGIIHQRALGVAADCATPIDPQSTLLFDGGTPGSSIIFNRACELAACAAEVRVVSQMCPSGQLAKLLRKTDYKCYFNRPLQCSILQGGATTLDQYRYGIRNSYQGSQYVHAKFILFKLHDGRKVCISGSHNFSWRGVRYGSTELAIESSEETLCEMLARLTGQIAAP